VVLGLMSPKSRNNGMESEKGSLRCPGLWYYGDQTGFVVVMFREFGPCCGDGFDEAIIPKQRNDMYTTYQTQIGLRDSASR